MDIAVTSYERTSWGRVYMRGVEEATARLLELAVMRGRCIPVDGGELPLF
jgi:hypothetical protein